MLSDHDGPAEAGSAGKSAITLTHAAPADLGQRAAGQVGFSHRFLQQIRETAARGSQELAGLCGAGMPGAEPISSVTPPPGDPTSRTMVMPVLAQVMRFARAAPASFGALRACPFVTRV
jgi:hypothetical protein